LRRRLIRIEPANHTPLCLVTSVLDEQALTDQQIARFYRMRWGQEVFHRSFKQTLAQHKMRSDSPAQAARELDWALMGYLILGLWSVEGLLGAGHDPLTWSVSESLRVVRGAMRQGGRLGGGSPGTLPAKGRERQLCAYGIEVGPELAAQEEGPSAWAAEDA
jgi:hypothetical protein